MPVLAAQREEFTQMWVNGTPGTVIAEHYKIHPSQVTRLRKELGLESRKGQWKHGESAYSNGKCRCDICTTANAIRQHRSTQRRYADQPKDPLDPRHGTASFYINHGCRCAPCLAAGSVNNKAVAKRRKARELRDKKSPLPK